MPPPDLAVIEALRASPIARALTAEQSQVLAGLVSLRSWQRGDVLAQEGTVDDRLLAIVEGSIAVVKHRGTPDEIAARDAACRRPRPRARLSRRHAAQCLARGGGAGARAGPHPGSARKPDRRAAAHRSTRSCAPSCAPPTGCRRGFRAGGRAHELRLQAARPVLTRPADEPGRDTLGSGGDHLADAAGVRRLRLAGLAQARHRRRPAARGPLDQPLAAPAQRARQRLAAAAHGARASGSRGSCTR